MASWAAMSAFKNEQFMWDLSSTELGCKAMNLRDASYPKRSQFEALINELLCSRISTRFQARMRENKRAYLQPN
jgi:hypothetical protein